MTVNDLVIEKMTARDIAVVAQMEEKHFVTPWRQGDLEATLQYGNTAFYVAKCEDNIVGYISRSYSYETADILTVCVASAYRKQGVASLLLEHLEKELRLLGVTRVFLEVRESNLAARALYEKNGYVFVNKRIRYYTNPVEDAWVMQKEIIQ